MKLYCVAILLFVFCAADVKPPRQMRKRTMWEELTANFGNIGQSLYNLGGMHPVRLSNMLPRNHEDYGKDPLRGVEPIVPGPAVVHARKFGHFSNEQLMEIERELIKYSRNHHAEVQSMRDFRRTLPMDPGLWTKEDRQRFDVRYNMNKKRIKEYTEKSRGIAKKWKIPPQDLANRPVTWVLDEEHLSLISEHMWKLAQKGGWTEKQRADFRKDLDLYMEMEQKILDQKAVARKKAMEAKAAAKKSEGKEEPPPTAKSSAQTQNQGHKKRQISEEAKKAHSLRRRLERAVFGMRFMHTEL